MDQKAVILENKGMSRDLSISKIGGASAYDNHNIRITADNHDTVLSVTNERGNKRVSLGIDINIKGTLLGYNILKNHIVLFTKDESYDYIYRVDYDGENFRLVSGSNFDTWLYRGNLNFSLDNPIESIVYFETENIQKVYWVDGKNILRFINIAADDTEISSWDDTSFDTSRAVDFSVSCDITKDNSGEPRANGVVQYILTYFNLHGQETGYAWVSDLQFLSPSNRGGEQDGNNNNRITLKFDNLDESYTNFRIYSVFRSSLGGDTVAYIVGEGETKGGEAIIIDDGAHLTLDDSMRLLYLGSQEVKPGTIAHKDQVLFLGDLRSIGRGDYKVLEDAIRDNMFSEDNPSWESGCVEFYYSDSEDESGYINDIPYGEDSGSYNHDSQLVYSSSDILSFKGGEKYRFAIVFKTKNGAFSDAFWIGDKVNHLYPIIDVVSSDRCIKRIIAKCTIPQSVIEEARNAGFATVQLMIAEATYADRSVKAQGIVNPTMFNTWNRKNNRLYSCPSWISRPRGSDFAWKHFAVVKNSISSLGEIECNYWTDYDNEPNPYYQYKNYSTTPSFVEEFDGRTEYDRLIIVLAIKNTYNGVYQKVYTVKATLKENSQAATDALNDYLFVDADVPSATSYGNINIVDKQYFTLSITAKTLSSHNHYSSAYNDMYDYLLNDQKINSTYLASPTKNQFCDNLCNWSLGDSYSYWNKNFIGASTDKESTVVNALNKAGRWITISQTPSGSSDSYQAAYYKKHLMFVDENVVTLDSPEIAYESVSFDNADKLKFRIVGVAKITGGYSDYTVDAEHGKLPGDNLIKVDFTNNPHGGLLSWPLWTEYGLQETTKTGVTVREDIKERTSEDYEWGGTTVRYWLHMFNRIAKINGFDDEDNSNYSLLHSKTFANLRYSYSTIYNNYDDTLTLDAPSIRVSNSVSSQYYNLKVGDETRFYAGVVDEALSVPGEHKYPIMYSTGDSNTSENINSTDAYLYSASGVNLSFSSQPHAVIALRSKYENNKYIQTILPKSFNSETISYSSLKTVTNTGALLPWIETSIVGASYPYVDYDVHQDTFTLNQDSSADSLTAIDKYLYIGEVYYDYDSGSISDDTRYGGISKIARENNRYVAAGPQYQLSSFSGDGEIIGNQGDTYFQRWDCLKTKEGASSGNKIIDITSAMLETHINIDGRTDNQRGTKFIASIDTSKFGAINPVYSQKDDFITRRDLNDDFNLDSYRSSVTWTMQKADSADIDEWTHITLANTLKLDGDKGVCRAIRRFRNSLISFQDKGIAEILFNSRTQLSSLDGVPVEIANSGKVDGKNYFTNKYGCLNKWSIVEGKSGLYFIDNINKMFCAASFDNRGKLTIDNISDKLGFGAWFRNHNSLSEWTPNQYNNFVTFHDKVHSDIYIISNDDSNDTCLVFNESLGAFTSFFDYGSIPMIANVEDRLVSFKDNDLWLQNEGLYCNFFGKQYDFWSQYRVSPDPRLDKIWTNVEYIADFNKVLDENGNNVVPESDLISGDFFDDEDGIYQEDETFDVIKVWNEYQTTPNIRIYNPSMGANSIRKDFRTWRYQIPRAEKSDTNKFGLDRIRNPWINIVLRKNLTENGSNQNLMQMHDVIIKYFQ